MCLELLGSFQPVHIGTRTRAVPDFFSVLLIACTLPFVDGVGTIDVLTIKSKSSGQLDFHSTDK